MVRQLRASLAEKRPNAFVADGYHLPFPAESFDKVLCTGVLMHVTDEFAMLREMERVLRYGGLLVCSMNNSLSPLSAPVRLKNHFKKGFIQNFRRPATYRRYLETLGLELLHASGDGLFATVPVSIGRFSFPPASAFPTLRAIDLWAVQKFARLAYEIWFTAAKVSCPCGS